MPIRPLMPLVLMNVALLAACQQEPEPEQSRFRQSQYPAFENAVRKTIHTTDMEALLKVSDLRFNYHVRETLPAATRVQVERLVDPRFLVAIELVAEAP